MFYIYHASAPASGLSLSYVGFQERQRLETIMNLCSEFSRSDQGPSTVADLQKINKELEKLQLSEDELSDSQASQENGYRAKPRDLSSRSPNLSLSGSHCGSQSDQGAARDQVYRDAGNGTWQLSENLKSLQSLCSSGVKTMGVSSNPRMKKEKEKLGNLEKKYSELTGGRGFPVNPNSMKEHFRTLEERKKSSKDGTYLSDTLPRKKSAPAVSPQFSSATLGRSVTPKSHLPLVQSASCGSMLPRNLSVSPKDLEPRRKHKGHNHDHMSEEQRQRSPEFYSRAASESNVYLDSFHYADDGYKDRAFDTLSLDSSDSMETSISACSPDNISR
ncbi:UNVERIFIED_CONTAM: hypothetical protein FKN15_005680 [Acipenser sinensis]